MTTRTSAQTKPELEFCCSFCGKSSKQVNKLIAGRGVFICDACVNLCNQILSGEIPPLTQEQVERLMDSGELID